MTCPRRSSPARSIDLLSPDINGSIAEIVERIARPYVLDRQAKRDPVAVPSLGG